MRFQSNTAGLSRVDDMYLSIPIVKNNTDRNTA